MATGFYMFTGVSFVFPLILGLVMTSVIPSEQLFQSFQLAKCFSLLLLGMFLSALATLNFSLSFLIGLFSFPFTIARPLPDHPLLAVLIKIMLQLTSPF